jgi:signal transduction histidine kinase
LIPAIAVAEFATLAFLGALHAMMPLPMTEALRLGGVLRWRLDDERVDLVVVVILVAPLFVFVINLAWVMEGLPAAIGFSLATFGPHLLMKLSNDRLGRVEGLLESKQQELKDLVHTVAHDLKSPISSALLTTDLVLDRDGSTLSSETRDDLGRVVRLLSRAEDMVRDLLRLFRIVWEPEKRSEIELDRTIAAVIETIQPKAVARGARIQTSALPRVWGQATKLEHAFSNLLENAVKHVPASGGAIAIEARVEPNAAVICVRDNGCGIPADYHLRIFELYSRVPRPGEPQSSGVGLAIVKRVVEAHGGRVWVESEIGSGSCFFVSLPQVILRGDEFRIA